MPLFSGRSNRSPIQREHDTMQPPPQRSEPNKTATSAAKHDSPSGLLGESCHPEEVQSSAPPPPLILPWPPYPSLVYDAFLTGARQIGFSPLQFYQGEGGELRDASRSHELHHRHTHAKGTSLCPPSRSTNPPCSRGPGWTRRLRVAPDDRIDGFPMTCRVWSDTPRRHQAGATPSRRISEWALTVGHSGPIAQYCNVAGAGCRAGKGGGRERVTRKRNRKGEGEGEGEK